MFFTLCFGCKGTKFLPQTLILITISLQPYRHAYLIFQTKNSVRSNSQVKSSIAPSGCKDIGIRKSVDLDIFLVEEPGPEIYCWIKFIQIPDIWFQAMFNFIIFNSRLMKSKFLAYISFSSLSCFAGIYNWPR